MNKQPNWIPWLYLALGLTQAAHSVEEVLTGLWKNLPEVTGLLHARLPFVPVLNWSAEGFAAANLVIVAVILGFSPFVFQEHVWAFKIAGVVAVIEVLNGALHIIPAIVKGGYWSGSISAIILFIIGLLILIRRVNSHELKKS
ncbi:MAG: HXXEE domain-containing protein [Anaerolineaceae bacterium]|nr:HXXEE domain-containing protein [Anaerolineaceae bacterium]